VLQKAKTAFRVSVATVHECMHKQVLYAFAMRNRNEAFQVRYVGMYPAVGDETDEVHLLALGVRISERLVEYGVIVQFALLDGLVDLYKILVNNATGADIHVTDFRVSHLPFGKPHGKTGGQQTTMWIFVIKTVDEGRVRLVNSGNLLITGDSPAVQNH